MNPYEEPDGYLITKQELASRLQVHVRTISTWMEQGWLPFIRPCYKVTRFVWEDVLEALRRHKRMD